MPLGLFIFASAVALPCLLVLISVGNANAQSTAALCAGASAYCLMAVNLFLATRPRGVERAFGGLDRLYKAHKWTGISVLPLILFHKFVGMDLTGQIIASGLAKTAVDIAKIAFWVLLVLLLISWIKRLPRMRRDLLPYGLWRLTHRAMGLVFIALTLHQFFVRVPFDANAMISVYLNFMAALGIVCFVYTQVFAPFRPKRFTVTQITAHPAATLIEATPKGRGFTRLRPGNFAVVSFGKSGLREPHPFTISGILPDGRLQFSIRALGDFTKRVGDTLAVGDRMWVEAGYGRFEHRHGQKQQVWVAGGIGITPFLAFADSLDAQNTRDITLIYCVGTQQEAVGLDRLHAAAARSEGFRLHLHDSATQGRITAETLVAQAGGDMSSAGLWFCGPAPMRDSLLRGLRALGQSPKSVHFEEFEFR